MDTAALLIIVIVLLVIDGAWCCRRRSFLTDLPVASVRATPPAIAKA